ncbi:glycosyltransferase family 2 protein [Microbacterium binotii]|uniref:glycosyltransferase family 2 protein n=1 Tax=Microbacterium binotii TaxID=462710 RepID=UPI001F1DB52D|nr:glycosyltransferase family A protein [Microbacterium binotii]UIN29859.1 glycosyltransferase family 2 protein [Microbacterium binotii]
MVARTSADPRVSIIMRTRNRTDLLQRALDDVFGQRFVDFELVIVDDADDAAPVTELVAALPAERAERVHLVTRAGEQHGRWPAANAGLSVARGEFITLHDDDDYWDPSFLDVMVSHLDAAPDAGAACCRTQIVIEREDEHGTLQRTDEYPFLPELHAITLSDMLRANRIPPISLLYRRALHTEVGPYDASLDVLGDWDFYLRAIAAHPIDLVDGPALAFWSHRPASTGAGENSISAQAPRAVTESLIRDARIREGLRKDGPSVFAHIAHETKWLDDRAAQRADTLAAERAAEAAQLERAVGEVRGELAQLRNELAALRSELHERGLMALLRRVRGKLRR